MYRLGHTSKDDACDTAACGVLTPGLRGECGIERRKYRAVSSSVQERSWAFETFYCFENCFRAKTRVTWHGKVDFSTMLLDPMKFNLEMDLYIGL